MGMVAIFNAIAALVPEYAGGVPQVYSFDRLPTALNTAQLPCRLLFPTQGQNASLSFNFVALGRTRALTLVVDDVLVIEPIAQGQFWATTKEAVRYIDDYAENIRLDRSLGMSQAHLTELEIHYGVMEYPLGSGALYRVVRSQLTIEEYKGG